MVSNVYIQREKITLDIQIHPQVRCFRCKGSSHTEPQQVVGYLEIFFLQVISLY